MDALPRPAGVPRAPSVAIALGANLGDPEATLVAVRPRLERLVADWWSGAAVTSRRQPEEMRGRRCHGRWSPLFLTAPVGGPPGQPPYRNAVLMMEGLAPIPDPLPLLRGLQSLEDLHGRQRRVHWGPRTLDLDLLWCGDLQLAASELTLPHPRWKERTFVLAPLAVLAPGLVPAGSTGSVAELLAARSHARSEEATPERLPPQPGWPE